uniref:Coenzyme Q6 monooxygenase n=1 Tax=Oncorhynchus kisutch TaxID=8019 RepID=A0A8C7D250_ONCKI
MNRFSGARIICRGLACAAEHGEHERSESSLEGKKILLLEAGNKKVMDKVPDAYSTRVRSISPGSATLLSGVGAWNHIMNMRCKPYQKMQFNALITFDKENLQDEMAYIVENDIIVAALTKQLENLSDQVKVQYKTKVVMYTWPKSHQVAESIPWVQVTLELFYFMNVVNVIAGGGDTYGQVELRPISSDHIPFLYSQQRTMLRGRDSFQQDP